MLSYLELLIIMGIRYYNMALRLSDYVIRGELINLRKNSTHGWLALDGLDGPLTFELTGDCDENLRGKHIRFEAAPNPFAERALDLRSVRLAPRQIGPTGQITAGRWVKTFECSVKEFVHRSRLGEAPPTTWKRLLYLEWFSQNGRVVVELAGAAIEVALDDDGEEWAPLPEPHPSPDEIAAARESADLPPQTGLEITIVSAEGGTRRLTLSGDEANDKIDRALFESALINGAPEEWDGIPDVDLFAEPQVLPDPDSLSDEQAEIVLPMLLTQMAMLGIALHVCEHYSALAAYRLLVERIFPETHVLDNVKGDGWTREFLTSEYCAACAAEAEAEAEARDSGE